MSIPNVELCTSKSFRIGAASDAHVLNIPVSDIRALDRWQSEVFSCTMRGAGLGPFVRPWFRAVWQRGKGFFPSHWGFWFGFLIL